MGDSPETTRFSGKVHEPNGPCWYRDNGSETVFVFVHGFKSDNQGCWLNEVSQTFWPDLASIDSDLNNPAIFLGGFPTDFESTSFGIRDAAEMLFGGLQNTTKGRRAALTCSRFVFICHSTGGLVVPRMLVAHAEAFREKTVGLLMVAVPSMGSPLASVANRLLSFLRNRMLDELGENSRFAEDLDYDFRVLLQGERSFHNLYGLEGYEHYSLFRDRVPRPLRYLFPEILKVVHRHSTSRYFAKPRLLYGTDHWSAAKPADARHPSHKMLNELIQLIERGKSPALQLEDRRVSPMPSNRFYFGSRQHRFVGRQAEMESLASFLASEGDFSWWLLLGTAGSGKSRLALEARLSHEGEWATGFWGKKCPDIEFWRSWQPEKPTFIVIDYLPGREESVHLMLLALSSRRETIRQRIRILLIERELGDAVEKVMGIGGDRAIVQSKRFREEPLFLGKLSDTNLMAIASDSATKAGRTSAGTTIIDDLNSADAATPLLAALVGEGNWRPGASREEFLRDYIYREEQSRWNPAKVNDSDKNLCALATMVNGIDVELLAVCQRDGIDLPTTRDYHSERLAAMTGFAATDEVHPLSPHLIGEFFVLERLTSLNKIARSTLLRLMWCDFPGSHLFVYRCRQDFPQHKMIPLISEAPSSSTELALGHSSLMLFHDFLKSAMKKESRARANELLAALDRVNGKRPTTLPSDKLRHNQRAQAHLYWAGCEAAEGRPEAAVQRVKDSVGHDLDDIPKTKWALELVFLIPLGELLQKLVATYSEQHRYADSDKAFQSLLFMAERSTVLEPVVCLTACAIHAADALENKGQGKDVLQRYERLQRIEASVHKKEWLFRPPEVSVTRECHSRLNLAVAVAAKSVVALSAKDDSLRKAAAEVLEELRRRTDEDSYYEQTASVYVQSLIISDPELRTLAACEVPQRRITISKPLSELTKVLKDRPKASNKFHELIASTACLAGSAVAFLENDLQNAIESWFIATIALKDAVCLDPRIYPESIWAAATLDLLRRMLSANMRSEFLQVSEAYWKAMAQVLENKGVFNECMMVIITLHAEYAARLEGEGDPSFAKKATDALETMAALSIKRASSEPSSGGVASPSLTENGGVLAHVACPRCHLSPKSSDLWGCTCGNRWKTFDTRGLCPACSYQWKETACLMCGESSPHADWYVGRP